MLAVSLAAGSIPFANIAARRARGVDLRRVGTGTVSGTSLYRIAGFGPLAAAGVFEVGKGAVGPLLAGRDRPVLQAAAAGVSVSAHNWSPLLGGAGGRGISPSIGALLAIRPEGAGVLLAGLIGGKLLGETAVGSLVADTALVPVLGRVGGRRAALAGTAVLLPMVVKRLMGNGPVRGPRWSTYANRLLFDRDTRAKT